MDTGTAPPTMSGTDSDIDWLRLIRSRRVGPATFHRLLAEHGSATAALLALPEIAARSGMADYRTCPEGVAAAELAAGRRAGAVLIRCDDARYPDRLREIDGAPPVLWVRGDPAWLSRDGMAVIGARNASSLGLRMARGMAAGLGEGGLNVVAGLARGIDTAAHDAALPTGTVAVMAGGVDVIYPPENASLAARIAESGALISEQPPGTEPQARHFPTRNRIVSGITRGVVVIEAACRSGTLITAKNALDQHRDVMAVPGHPMDARASGCNALIRDGATLVRSAADVIDALGALPLRQPPAPPKPPAAPRRSHRDAGGPVQLEGRIMSRLGPSPTDENDLIRDLGVSAATASAAILALELEGRVQRLAGGRLAIA
ncbi:DNA-processing protein DprA [Paracoccus sp. 1_MG-2023]|uniref:DNA-processing protein DprA n=1 Tax=unclassified Paracoccus (in: a-proteobacteria) TaxID=2688777 RepID=UPI001C087A9F|nr:MULTISPECIES: DNA-processing protein DprA [unclassified Paracoccus (in: a-proteobacteria)]MBU2957537.1 DNA-processing protein DprA [Paracoccus sp. C2R09]MDO6669803.1 DNA-processing protein DprA [Paracoccus sp. 1_MG-2023]